MNSTILNDIVRDYESVTTAWFNSLFPIAQAVFWTLVAIELIWSAIWWVVDSEDGLGVITALLRTVLAVGFFYALLLYGGTWFRAVIQGFSLAGSSASGVGGLSPTGVFDQGLALANEILNSVEGLGILEGIFPSLVAAFTGLVVVVSFALIAAQLLVALVESFIAIGAGILFVGFSGARWTKFFTERYLSYVASVGVKLFVLYLIMGLGMGIAARWMPILERGGFSPIPFFYVMGGSLVFVFLTWHIPSVAGSMMAGAVSLSLADAVYPAMLGSRAAGAGLVTAGAVGAAAMGGVRWGVDRLRVHTSLHTANGQLMATQPSTTGASTAPAPHAGQAGSSSGSEPRRPSTSTGAGSTRESGGPSKDPSTPGAATETDPASDENRPG